MYKKVIQGLLFAGAAFAFVPSDICAMVEETPQQRGARQKFVDELKRLSEQRGDNMISQEQFEAKFEELLKEHKRELPPL
jgi:hypothetical protein